MKTWFFKYQVRDKTVFMDFFLQSPPAYFSCDLLSWPSRAWASMNQNEVDTRYSGAFVAMKLLKCNY